MAVPSRLSAELARLRSLDRANTLAVSEGISAVTHLIASLEYLANERDRARGGLNNWDLTRRNFPRRSRIARRAADLVADRRVTRALHIARITAAASLLTPLPRKSRLAADAVLAATSAAMYPRHHYGTDGSDQGSFLVQSVAMIARMGQRQPKLVDACLWYLALQAVLSYTVSGWVKMSSSTWRSGRALPGVMRTLSYGDRTTWELLERHPRFARLLGNGTLAMECAFPAAFLAGGRLAPVLTGSAASFHLINTRVMGLGRFLWSFVSMHPAVLYATGPRDRVRPDGRSERRDDSFPKLSAALAAASFGAGLVAQVRRHRAVLSGRPGEKAMTTSNGNTLSYRLSGTDDATRPIVILESGLAMTPEHWEWIQRGLAQRFPVVSYRRAGYGTSRYAGGRGFQMDDAVQDLVDLVRQVAGDRPVVLVGHSLGGYLVLKAAARLQGQVRGLGLLDSSHPGELRRSPQQAEGQQVLTSSLALLPASMRLGLGPLLKRPGWADSLPREVRRSALAQYRDTRVWTAARREWRATVEEFDASDGQPPEIRAPALVVTAGNTAFRDPIQKDLHDELAKVAPRSERHVLEGVDHDQLLVDPAIANRVVELVTAFTDGLEKGGEERP